MRIAEGKTNGFFPRNSLEIMHLSPSIAPPMLAVHGGGLGLRTDVMIFKPARSHCFSTSVYSRHTVCESPLTR